MTSNVTSLVSKYYVISTWQGNVQGYHDKYQDNKQYIFPNDRSLIDRLLLHKFMNHGVVQTYMAV